MPTDSPFDPENRQLYTELMQPPEGYAFDCAVATTYSLDFTTALVIPTAIAFRDGESRDDMLGSPMALLEGVERLAKKLAIYCDRGRIKGARPDAARLMALYENTIIEVNAPGRGAFHPKLWCLRFTSKIGPPKIRLAVLSRNLTNDKCWDLTLSLDGVVGTAEQPHNFPVAEFLKQLPKLADPSTRPSEPKFLKTLSKDLAHSVWELPAGATQVSFGVNGMGDDPWILPKGERLAVVSPFVTEDALNALSNGFPEGADRLLISRAEELDTLSDELKSRFTIKTLDERASDGEGGNSDEEAKSISDLEGLHAKAFIVEDRTKLRISIGSANATSAALLPFKGRSSNVEVMATLSGPKSRMGDINSILCSEPFSKLLTDYSPAAPPQLDAAMEAERILERLQTEIARLPLAIRCSVEEGNVRLVLSLAVKTTILELPFGIACFVRPLTLANEHGSNAASLLAGDDLDLGCQPLGDITRWLGVRLIHITTGAEIAFTLGAKLIGLPDGRDEAVLRALIANSDNFFRYLNLLLGTLGEGNILEGEAAGEGQWARLIAHGEDSLLEPLVRALCAGGSELDDINRLIKRLEDPAGGSSIVPESFLQLWRSFTPFLKSGA